MKNYIGKIVSLGLACAILSLIFSLISLSIKVVQLKQEKHTNHVYEKELAYCNGQLVESDKYNIFHWAAERVGSKEWSKENNCYDHSKELQSKLREQGIESSIFITPTRDHAFVGVWIEANTGRFIEPGKYQVGELRDSDLNVVCD